MAVIAKNQTALKSIANVFGKGKAATKIVVAWSVRIYIKHLNQRIKQLDNRKRGRNWNEYLMFSFIINYRYLVL